MTSVVIGKTNGKNAHLDLDALLRGRLLIQANSGKGKSWLLRRLAEALFGKVQVIIIDPEGEFATLREKYGYVLVGKGGETPADPRSAALVAHKLLELRASAVCDLYEMKPYARHEWVAKFLEAMIDSPKNLWHPCVVIVDEAHIFCPEKGAGESVAAEAIIGMATRGRKRGFALVLATQRLGKVRKDAAAELLNVMIGGTFIDIDRKRAADALGIYGKDQHKFFDEIKVLKRGLFFALGPAICNERILIEVGPVQTTHPEAGSARHAAEPPPAPEAIAKLLPKLSDLPKAAEEKAKTEAELRTEIRSLKGQLRTQPAIAKEVKVVDQQAIDRAVRETYKKLGDSQMAMQNAVKRQWRTLKDIAEAAAKAASLEIPEVPNVKFTPQRDHASVVPHRKEAKPHPPQHVQTHRPAEVENNGDLSGPEQRILNAIAWMESIGIAEPEQTAVAFLAGYSYGGGGFNNPRGALRVKGMVEYRGSGIALTDSGRSLAHAPETPLTTEELHGHVLRVLPGPEQKLLTVLLQIYPENISKDDLAERVGYAPGSGGFNNPCGRLRTLGLVDYPTPGKVVAKDILFVE
jgi:uncharacterized protein DUF87